MELHEDDDEVEVAEARARRELEEERELGGLVVRGDEELGAVVGVEPRAERLEAQALRLQPRREGERVAAQEAR